MPRPHVIPPFRIRPGTASDYAAYVALFPELGVDNRTPSQESFESIMAPNSFVAERSQVPSDVIGFAYFQLLEGLTYIRNVIVEPRARRQGVGRALMNAIDERARESASTAACLNVKAANEAAIALYASCGFARAYESQTVRIAWADVARAPEPGSPSALVRTRIAAPEEYAHVEATMGVAPGLIAFARNNGRIPIVAEGPSNPAMREDASGHTLRGIALFAPRIPRAFPFRANSPDDAFALLRAMKFHAMPEDETVNVTIEDQPGITEALLSARATLRDELVHMRASL